MTRPSGDRLIDSSTRFDDAGEKPDDRHDMNPVLVTFVEKLCDLFSHVRETVDDHEIEDTGIKDLL